MATIISYTSLQSTIADYLGRTDVSTGLWVENFIQNFEERFYRDSANWASWMETPLSVAVSSNVAVLPSDYLGLRIAYFSGGQPLKRVSLEQLYSRYPRGQTSVSAGTTSMIARNVANFEFGPQNASGTLLGTYYRKPTLLRDFPLNAIAHFLILNAPDLLLYGSLLEAVPFIKDDARVPLWQAATNIALDAYRNRFIGEDESGAAPFTVAM